MLNLFNSLLKPFHYLVVGFKYLAQGFFRVGNSCRAPVCGFGKIINAPCTINDLGNLILIISANRPGFQICFHRLNPPLRINSNRFHSAYSSAVNAPFSELQALQERTRFLSSVFPPRLAGIIWSLVASLNGNCFRQYGHTKKPCWS